MWKKYLTIKEASELLNVTPLTLRNWDKKGKLKAYRHPVNNYRLYASEDIEKLGFKVIVSKPRKLQVKFREEEDSG
ncbi:MAG: hypothetical protein COU27_01310 [Candidatus Levybacteria bacterium CG10_big_fil_rev_8_21_14_0_10_36_7]|nr:MAG: hypothetical protein COU27_01310 [Candidatus Levybacteria bacterium CG10_big_fil_rev_8_21_14_0_10_36_7]